MKKISIITVTYNCIDTIERTIKSVLQQSYTNYEYIVVDGDSTDGTKRLLDKYKDVFSYYISEPDSGVYNAMNKALKHVTGDIVEFLNGDDYFIDKYVLERVNNEFENNPDMEVLVGKDKLGIVSSVHYPEKYTSIYVDTVFPHQAVFSKYKVFLDIGFFDESYRICSDRDWLLNAWSKNYNFRFVDDVYVYFEKGGSSFSSDTSLEECIIAKKYLIKTSQRDLLPFAYKYCMRNYADWLLRDSFEKEINRSKQSELWKGLLNKDSGCIVWGQGTFGELFIKSLIENGYIINKIIDNSLTKNKNGIVVEKYEKQRIDEKVVIATTTYDDSICSMMKKDGIEETIIVSFQTIRKKWFDYLDTDNQFSDYVKEKTGLDIKEYL